MKITSLMLGPLGVNCYIIEAENGDAIAVDIGGNADKLLDYIFGHSLKLKKILLTHGHFDHIGGVKETAEKTGAEVYVHIEDAEMLTNSVKNLGMSLMGCNIAKVDNYITVKDNDEITLNELKFRVMSTPGHTKGSVCYIEDNEKVIFSGDTLFKLSAGRTDFEGGSSVDMKRSFKRLADIEGDYAVYPGHNDATTLDYERKYNPYMRELDLYDDNF